MSKNKKQSEDKKNEEQESSEEDNEEQENIEEQDIVQDTSRFEFDSSSKFRPTILEEEFSAPTARQQEQTRQEAAISKQQEIEYVPQRSTYIPRTEEEKREYEESSKRTPLFLGSNLTDNRGLSLPFSEQRALSPRESLTPLREERQITDEFQKEQEKYQGIDHYETSLPFEQKKKRDDKIRSL